MLSLFHDNVGAADLAKMEAVPKHLLLFAASTGYQIRVFAEAAERLGVDVTLVSDHCDRMEELWGHRAIAVKFDRIGTAVQAVRGENADGVAAVGDLPAVLAAEAAEAMGVPFHPAAAARACHDKYLARQLYQAAGLPLPQFFRAALDEDPRTLAARAPYPCVLKPLGLSASRGVIRANHTAEFVAAFERIRKIGEKYVQVESYIPGKEFAVEGLVTEGRFQPLALFDKPDPLEGPFFEETIYVTPSRESEAVQQALLDTAARAVRALGLRHGPVHVELRYNEQSAWILETHARPIGGLCARALRLRDPEGRGYWPLEELVLRHALGEDVSAVRLDGLASGVMMIPIPKGGIYQSVEGVERAAVVAGIEDVVITAKVGQQFVPLPEGSSYLGFLFARGNSPAMAEAALRQSHAELKFHIATALDTFRPSP